jgi:RNA polymerase sigma factor (sigma-70 family)
LLKISTTKKSIEEKNDLNLHYDEQELIGKIKNSCSKSFQLIFMKYYEILYRFIWLRTHDSELSRDLVQDVFLRVWDNRRRLDTNKSFKAYLYQISNNLVIDMIRKNRTKEKLFKINQSLNYYESEDQYYTNIDIQNAMNKLPEKLKVIVILSRFEGLNYVEIAEICNVSFQTVFYRLNKALKLMSNYLSDK